MSIVHNDLCFGCGQANLLGLQMELEPADTGVAGRFFVKQDHQGLTGKTHGGVIAAALDEAMALAVWAEGLHAVTARLQVALHFPPRIGTFVDLEARIERREGDRLETKALATGDDGTRLARATAIFVKIDSDSV